VVDVIGSEIAGWPTWYCRIDVPERYDDLNVELFREPFVALRQRCQARTPEANWWIARELA